MPAGSAGLTIVDNHGSTCADAGGGALYFDGIHQQNADYGSQTRGSGKSGFFGAENYYNGLHHNQAKAVDLSRRRRPALGGSRRGRLLFWSKNR